MYDKLLGKTEQVDIFFPINRTVTVFSIGVIKG